MSSRFRLTFQGITRAVFQRLRKRAAQNGIQVSRSRGEAVKDGVRIAWNYDVVAATLEVECTSTGFWIDVSHAGQRLAAEIESTLNSERAA